MGCPRGLAALRVLGASSRADPDCAVLHPGYKPTVSTTYWRGIRKGQFSENARFLFKPEIYVRTLLETTAVSLSNAAHASLVSL